MIFYASRLKIYRILEAEKKYPISFKDDEAVVLENSGGVLFASTCVKVRINTMSHTI